LVWGIRDFASWNENSTLVHGGGCHLTSTSCHGMLGWAHKLFHTSYIKHRPGCKDQEAWSF
jgi:hypothetical protein